MRKHGPFLAAYIQCRKNAKRRGIPFKLSLEQFTAIWKRSRRWQLRGCRRGQYVLARFKDKGIYENGNVRVILAKNNTKEMVSNLAPKRYNRWIARLIARNKRRVHSKATRAKISASMAGKDPRRTWKRNVTWPRSTTAI